MSSCKSLNNLICFIFELKSIPLDVLIDRLYTFKFYNRKQENVKNICTTFLFKLFFA